METDPCAPIGSLEFENLPAWKGILAEFNSGSVPHCRAVSAPPDWHPGILDRLSRLTLGISADEPSPVNFDELGIRAAHPDIVVIGSVGKAPSIESCRELIGSIAMKPESASCRIGVVMCADNMQIPAANSLLKLAEEPPSHAHILFMMELGSILPTLRSRARFTLLNTSEHTAEIKAPPASDAEWLRWAASARTSETRHIADTLNSWSAWAASSEAAAAGKNFALAGRLERLRLIAEEEKISAPMLCDLLILALREELPFEHLFGDVW